MAGRNAINMEDFRRGCNCTAICSVRPVLAAPRRLARGKWSVPQISTTVDNPRAKDTSASPTGSPYYLWDTKRRVSVVVNDLPLCPDYACISHTWCPWVDELKLLFELPGVPWLIPEVKTERFVVEELPEQLGRLSHHYIWLDLFCIPQVPIAPWNTRNKAQELDVQRERAEDEIA